MIYLDTSAAVPMFIPEPASDAIDAWYQSCADVVVTSDWTLTEFASALSIKVRRGEISSKQAQSAWKDFEAFCGAGLRTLPVSRKAFLVAAHMTRDVKGGLRSGDSLHLAIALEVGAAGMATADGTLEKNAKAMGLSVNRF